MERGSHNSSIKMKKTFFLFLVSFISLGSSSSEINNLIVTEVQVARGEFLEIYNPTSEEIELCSENTTCVYLSYFPKENEWNKTFVLNHAFPNNIKISPRSYIVVGFYNYSGLTWQPYKSQRLANKDGAIGLFSCNPHEKSVQEAKSCLIDLVSWGKMTHVKLDQEAIAPSNGKSLVRRFNTETNTYQNTKNNAEDFFICDTPKPGEFNTECSQIVQPETQNPLQTKTPLPQQNSTPSTIQTQDSSQELIALSSSKIDLNTATAKELEELIGVGPLTAQEIIKSRPFCSLEDLLKVNGIGQAILRKIKTQNLAYVKPCEQEQQTKEIEQSQDTQQTNTSDSITKKENRQTESVINLAKQQKSAETITGKVVYQSKTESVRRYAIYAFSILLIVILFLILKR